MVIFNTYFSIFHHLSYNKKFLLIALQHDKAKICVEPRTSRSRYVCSTTTSQRCSPQTIWNDTKKYEASCNKCLGSAVASETIGSGFDPGHSASIQTDKQINECLFLVGALESSSRKHVRVTYTPLNPTLMDLHIFSYFCPQNKDCGYS